MNIDFEAIAFVIMSLMAILGALGCVYARRVAHSLLSLMMTFFAVAGVFVLAQPLVAAIVDGLLVAALARRVVLLLPSQPGRKQVVKLLAGAAAGLS